MSTSKALPRMVFVGATLFAACATSPRARPESSQRVPDSAPDKVAAQRTAAGLRLEEEDDRWGFTAARELRQRKEQKQRQQGAPSPAPDPGNLAPPAPGAVP